MSQEIVICGVPFEHPDIKEILKTIKQDGFTSVQIYVLWREVEETEGAFDFSQYDKYVNLIKEAGLKFVPFIITGPYYAAPKWWIESGHKGLKCLEHSKESLVESIWNEAFKTQIDKIVKAFADHYLPMDILESIQPGICGDYGEAIMPVHGNFPGAYHTHSGMWCNDDGARKSFKSAMQKKYKRIDKLNKTWRAHYQSFDEIEPFLKHMSPSSIAWFDLIEWYRGEMTQYSEFWMKTCRKYFPDTPVYLCTGGIEDPHHASLFSDQAKICAKYNGGIRLTNEKNDFFENFFSCTAYTHSACEYYGAYYGLEPVGSITKEGVVSRIFSSSLFGNRQLFFYYGNIYENNDMDCEHRKNFLKNIHYFKERKTNKATAILWPQYVSILDGGLPQSLYDFTMFMRKRTDYRFANESMILDGILDEVKLLILPGKVFTTREVLLKICEWVHGGGVLFVTGEVTDLNLNPVDEFNKMLGFTDETEMCEGNTRYTIQTDCGFEDFISTVSYPSEIGYNNLSDDTISLAYLGKKYNQQFRLEYGEVHNAFMRKHGKGLTISYFGPVKLDYDPQKTGTQDANLSFPALLDNVVLKYSKDLKTKDDEVVRGEIDGKIYAYYANGTIKEVE